MAGLNDEEIEASRRGDLSFREAAERVYGRRIAEEHAAMLKALGQCVVMLHSAANKMGQAGPRFERDRAVFRQFADDLEKLTKAYGGVRAVETETEG